MDSKVTLLVRHDSEQLSTMCRNYGTNQHDICPKGVFVCPFMRQNEIGGWIMDIPCSRIKSSDWEVILNSAKE